MDLTTLIFPAILFGVLLLFLAIFLIVSKRQKGKSSINKTDKSEGSKVTVNKDTGKTVPREDIFNFMEFEKILNNMIVQNDGTKFTMAIKCKGINYDLMSDVEQIAVEEGFITFLNTLRFPIQLYVQAQNIDLKETISIYKQNASNIKNEYEQVNKKYTNLVEQFDSDEKEIKSTEEERDRVLNVYEYASDIINYVERLSLNKNLLQRNFYVLVSYYSSEITSADNFSKDEILNICYNELLTRAQTIISALSACSVTGEILNSNELADLLYMAYNRDDKGFLSVREAIQSGFYRLYSTSEDVFMKKQEKLQEQIDIEAQYRALDAMKKAIQGGDYISPEVEQIDVVDRISKQAAEIVKNEPLPDDIKDKAKKILVDEYKADKQKILNNSQINSIKDNNESENIENNEESQNVEKDIPKNDEESENQDNIVLDNRMGFETPIEENNNNEVDNNTNTSDSSDDDLII